VTLHRYCRQTRPGYPELFSNYVDPDDRTLPDDLFATLQQRFGFTVDAAASAVNARLPRYWSVDVNGLSQSWSGERVYVNPPYSSIRPWVEKALRETDADLIVMLLPANRTEQDWWQELVEPIRDRDGSRLHTEFQRGRWRFIKPGSTEVGPNERPPFSIVLLIIEPTSGVKG
jgi:phage N-6-adenine-methyltransferase